MNSLALVNRLITEKTEDELSKYLSDTWDRVWSDTDKKHGYAKLRLFKTVDKINNIIKLGVDFRDKNVADLGCGNGIALIYLRKYFNITGIGVDISKEIIDGLKADANNPSLSFVIGDHRNLKLLSDDQFDIVLSFGVIEHFEEYGLALAEARRILKPGGKLVLIQPNLFSFGVIQEYYLRAIGAWKFGKQKDFSLFYYRSLLRQSGYRNIRYLTMAPYPDMYISRFLDNIFKILIPFWGHYLYLTAEK
ncbi:MAG: class I SAM-dependent methyltransferase [Patescibacteria group bacterium]|nr:class I SAM-dependent methyltransferase [Patescibacteria group bacterium]